MVVNEVLKWSFYSFFIFFVYGDDTFYEDRQPSTFKGRNYVIVASQILRSRVVYGIAVHVYDDTSSASYEFHNRSFQFHATITSDDNEILSYKETLYWNSPQLVNLPVPTTLMPAAYQLHVAAVNPNGMVIFNEFSNLTYNARFTSVVFQTTRPIYSSGQTIRFRILVLETSLLPFNDVMDVFILDPNDLIVKRWLSVYTNNGVASLKFKLPKLAKNGLWKLRAKINNQIDEKSVLVQTYFQPLFEVIVASPSYITVSEEKITAAIDAIFPSQKHIRGNASVSWLARKITESEFQLILLDTAIIKEQKHEIFLPTESIRVVFDNLSGVEVKILVNITEFMSGETVSGFSHTRIISSKVVVKFLSKSPIVFTPGGILQGRVAVCYEDGQRIPAEILENSIIKVQMKSDASLRGKQVWMAEVKGSYDQNDFQDIEFYDIWMKDSIKEKYLDTGIVSYSFDVPENATNVELLATYTNENENIVEEINVVKKYSPSAKFVNVWTSSEDLVINDYAVFHVKTNFETRAFYTLIIAKGIVLQFREHEVESGLVTFSEPVSGDMAPLFHLIVYCISKENIMYGDAATVPVNGFERYETTLEINTGKDFRNEHLEIIASGAEGAFIGVQAVRSIVHLLQGGHEITTSRMTDSFLTFEKNYKSISKLTRGSRNGETATESFLFASQNYIFDTYDIFSLNSLSLMTSLNISVDPRLYECERQNFQFSCITEGCFPISELCDGTSYCTDATDESNCMNPEENREEYFLNRVNWHSFIFDVEEGDWAFREIKKNDHEGIEFEPVDSPQTADEWYFSTFNMDMVFGFSMIKSPVVFSTKRPLMAHVLGPSECRRGEQLGLKLHLHNFDVNRMLVMVTLLGSDHYKFIHVEEDGVVASYTARLTSGDHQILLYMPPKSEDEIHFPVAPSVEQGLIEINFELGSQAGRKQLSHKVQVLGEGALINRHTSVTLDLKNRGLVLQYLDIVVEETPVIPYEIWRRYVFGSPTATVTLSNDVIGPVIPERLLTTKVLLKRESKGAIDILFELYTNIWTLHYLRYTNQLKWDTLRDTLYECNSLYAEVIRYFHKNGSFGHWETLTVYRPSVWLTAWALRVLNDGNFPDWEFHFWVDPYIFTAAINWLLKQQDHEGYFVETSYYDHPFDGRILRMTDNHTRIALTTHVLISLYTASETVDGQLKSDVIVSCSKARRFLEKTVTSLNDPYLIATVTYAFFITSSPELAFAFSLLQRHIRINEDGLYYWSRLPIASNPIKLENQRPYIRPRLYQETDSTAVEATSWAVLVYLAHDGVTSFVENIVQWLASVRMTENGFISVIDTGVAYRALAEFALRSRILQFTNIDVSIEMMASKMTKHRLHIANASTSNYNLKVPYVWGHVNVAGKGSGVAFVQLDVNYGIDDERLVDVPQINSFDLHISEFYSYYRNKSTITIQSCLKYITSSSTRSGAVILEIQIPTGYHMLESEAIDLVASNVHPSLRDARTVEGKTIWFFDYIDSETNCFNHTIKRWYPVANLTLCRHALLYEITARERFLQVLINSTELYILSICEVCGSFQCPYCPHYNTASNNLLPVKINLIFLLLINYFDYFFLNA